MNLRRAVTLAGSQLNTACATQQRGALTGPFVADFREGSKSAEPSLGSLEEPSNFVESHDGCQSSVTLNVVLSSTRCRVYPSAHVLSGEVSRVATK